MSKITELKVVVIGDMKEGAIAAKILSSLAECDVNVLAVPFNRPAPQPTPDIREPKRLFRFVNGLERKPKEDHYDEPTEYLVRIKGDDPRSGWVFAGYMTLQEMEKDIMADYWEWLEEQSPATSSPLVQPDMSRFKPLEGEDLTVLNRTSERLSSQSPTSLLTKEEREGEPVRPEKGTWMKVGSGEGASYPPVLTNAPNLFWVKDFKGNEHQEPFTGSQSAMVNWNNLYQYWFKEEPVPDRPEVPEEIMAFMIEQTAGLSEHSSELVLSAMKVMYRKMREQLLKGKDTSSEWFTDAEKVKILRGELDQLEERYEKYDTALTAIITSCQPIKDNPNVLHILNLAEEAVKQK